MGQMLDDGVSLEDSAADSPSNTQDGLSGTNPSFDGTIRPPNGKDLSLYNLIQSLTKKGSTKRSFLQTL